MQPNIHQALTIKGIVKEKHPLREIFSVQFSISSPEDITKKSVCEITTHKLNGEGSLYDPRMGAMNMDELCVSCGKDSKECPGHSGHIVLNEFVAHPMFYRYITNFLKCVCIKCNRVLLSEDHFKFEGILKYTGVARFEKVVEILEKIDLCYYCNSAKPKFTFQQKTSEIMMSFEKKKAVMQEGDVKKIFDNIIDEDIKLLGFNPVHMRPKDLILSVIEVIPPRARPYVYADGVACDDDLTTSYAELVKANKILAEDDASGPKKDKALQTLKFRLKTMFNNSQNKARHSNGRALKCIKSRLSGKEGLIRKNLMGKRRNMSGRTVISADPTVRTDELVVPPDMVSNLTMPILVGDFNLDMLQKIVDEGRANYVIKQDGSRINLKYATVKKGTIIEWGDKIIRGDQELPAYNEIKGSKLTLMQGDKILRKNGEIIQAELQEKKYFKLEKGWIVERWLIEGDIVLLNRQPTLHTGSIMAKKILIRPGKTLRFNLATCKSYNSDFDSYCQKQEALKR